MLTNWAVWIILDCMGKSILYLYRVLHLISTYAFTEFPFNFLIHELGNVIFNMTDNLRLR